MSLVDHPSKPRLFPVGRLDFESTGLVLLTNDGEIANVLSHPRFGVEKVYHAMVKRSLHDTDRGVGKGSSTRRRGQVAWADLCAGC